MMLIMMFVPTVKKKYGENLKKCKNRADKKMVKALDALPYKQRQWGHAAAFGKVILRKMLSQDQLVSQARNFGLIQKKVLSCVW